MNKLDKEQIKKLVLGAICLVALLYVYFNFFIGPLHHSEQTMQSKIAELQGKVASSKTEIAKAGRLEESARAATAHYEALRALTPEGAPIAWFPPRIKTFFAEQHIDKANARLDSTGAPKEKELSDWSRYIWTIDLPQADFITLGKAIALLENSEPLLSVRKIGIRANNELPQLQQATLTVATIIDKK
ncbi:MAG: hypothetical protein JO354_09080 [Verrucomicrobia bacterium]|nr:hypothetical protein [Verrucomicrobiota bacterium]